MLKRLELRNVGPASHLALNPVAPRFNFLTGDNGLGKSFLLEAAWWALTRTWHETPAVPNSPEASISYSFDGLGRTHSYNSKWDIKKQQWNRKPGRPPNPGLVIYARVDGSFSVWDPARNYVLWQRADGGKIESPPSYQFTTKSVLDGLRRTINLTGIPQEELICAGLIDDWTRWHQVKEKSPQYKFLCRLLEQLGPEDQPLSPGVPIAPYFGDQRKIPTIRMPYGQDVPITYAPAGVKRMTMLAYLLAWCFSEHQRACKRINQPLSSQIIVLIDEPETHLHPRWQRTALPSLYNSVDKWNASKSYRPTVQFMVATHSPLVMASMEAIFDESKDSLWKLDLSEGSVNLEKDDWYKRGDVNRWLMSDVFDLEQATSREIEAVMSEAAAVCRDAEPNCQEVKRIDSLLIKLLPPQDPFYSRWHYLMGKHLED